MLRGILVLVVVCLIGYFVWYEIKQHPNSTARLQNGGFTCQGCDSPDAHARFLKENSGETPDGDREHKFTSARVAAEDAEAGITPGDPYTQPRRDAFDTRDHRDADDFNSRNRDSRDDRPVVVPTTGQPGAVPAGIPPQQPRGFPRRDSLPANPPNDSRFAGSGTYQWYRQGDITYRIDTVSGRSCVIYATMQEWRKETVRRNGCGRDF